MTCSERRRPMIDYYARRAGEYERIYEKPERQADLRILRGWVEETFKGTQVLEVACGTGYWTEILARSAACVVATDINEDVLAVARAKKLGEHVTLRNADAYALPLPGQAFDAGFAGFWWSHVPRVRLRGFLSGFHGVLAPGAKVAFIDNVYVEGSSTPISRSDDEGNTYQVRRLTDGSTHEVIKNFPSEPELRAAAGALGTDVQVRFLEYYWILSYRLTSFQASIEDRRPGAADK